MTRNVPAFLEHFQHVISECVSVLLKEPIDIIEHLSSIVMDTKLGIVHLRLDVIGVVLGRDRERKRGRKGEFL